METISDNDNNLIVAPKERRPVISVRGLRKQFGDKVVFDSVDLDLWPGEVVGVIGPSGSGKSTLMHSIALLDGFDSGAITYSFQVNREPLTVDYRAAKAINRGTASKLRRHMGFIFQSSYMLYNFNALQNTHLPHGLAQAKHDRVTAKTREQMVNRLGLRTLVAAQANELSGGQRQRFGVMRALAHEPEVVFADEPTGNLDPGAATIVATSLVALAKETFCTVMLVTHDLGLAATFSDRILLISDKNVGDASFSDAEVRELTQLWCRSHDVWASQAQLASRTAPEEAAQ